MNSQLPTPIKVGVSFLAVTLLKRSLIVAGLCLFLLMVKTPPLQANDPPPERHRLRVGVLQTAFFGLNSHDAEAAFKVFAKSLGNSYHYDIDVSVQVFGHITEVNSLPPEERPELLIFSSWNYLQMENADWLDPRFFSSIDNQIATPYLLIGGRGQEIVPLEKLKGKSLNIFYGASSTAGDYWLQTLLRDLQLSRPEDYFGRVEYKTDPAAAVLPVFFDKTDMALIAGNKLALMVELNPQLKRMPVLKRSKPLIDGVICLNRTGWSSASFRRDVLQSMQELHKSPAGQQILTLFKIDRLAPYEKHQLDTMRLLQQRFLAYDQANQ